MTPQANQTEANMTDQAQLPPAQDLKLQDLYPIREVSRLTGVNSVTLRAWERRYGLLSPHRTESGHRLYSMADIERVRVVTAWIERGVAVSKVATIIDRQVAPPRATPEASVATGGGPLAPVSAESWQARLVSAVNDFDVEALDRVHGQLHATVPFPVVYAEVLLPVWRRYLAQSEQPSVQWQFLDAFLRGRAFQRLGFAQPGQPKVLLAVLSGSLREFEVLVAALGVAAVGAQVLLVTESAAPAELQLMAERTGCAALVLYSERSLDTATLTRHLPRLEQALECPLAVLGAVCDMQQAQLEAARLVCLGSNPYSFTGSLRNLLAGRLDS